jgi:hypothetical protein
MARLNNYMNMNKGYFLSIVLFCVVHVNAQILTHVEPANWWVGMEHHQVQILLHGNNIANYQVQEKRNHPF